MPKLLPFPLALPGDLMLLGLTTLELLLLDPSEVEPSRGPIWLDGEHRPSIDWQAPHQCPSAQKERNSEPIAFLFANRRARLKCLHFTASHLVLLTMCMTFIVDGHFFLWEEHPMNRMVRRVDVWSIRYCRSLTVWLAYGHLGQTSHHK
jgi:hypothetical protein